MASKRPLRRRSTFLLLAAAVAAMTGCADGRQADDPPPSTPHNAVVTNTRKPLELISATGTVVTGTQPGCLLLDTDVKRYHLAEDRAAELQPGQKVMVTGLFDPNLLSTCEAAGPLTIDEISPAG